MKTQQEQFFQVITKYQNGKFNPRIEPQSYWVDVTNGEEIQENYLTKEQAEKEVKCWK